MKVIDLLNKIANGEEVPKEIRIGDKIDIFYYQDYIKSYKTYDDEYLMCEYLCNTDRLNDEVEIIEEDKNIRKLSKEVQEPKKFEEIVYIAEDLARKINEIIDYINKEKKW